MLHTWYWAVFNHWYIADTLLYIRHTPCTCRIRSIGPYSTIDTYTLLYIRHSFCTCRIHYFYAIFNQWYIRCALLYIRHTPCTCCIRGIGPYTNGDTWPVDIYTSDIHPAHIVYTVLCHIQPMIHSLCTFIHQTYTLYINPVHVVYTVLGHIQPLIHSLYTFIHQTYTLYMPYTQYWAIFNRWYIAYTLLYFRHTPCTCSTRVIGRYSTSDT